MQCRTPTLEWQAYTPESRQITIGGARDRCVNQDESSRPDDGRSQLIRLSLIRLPSTIFSYTSDVVDAKHNNTSEKERPRANCDTAWTRRK